MKTKSKLSAYILRGSAAAVLFSCVVVALCSAINLSEQPPKASPPQDNSVFGANGHQSRSLSFADRVAYQRAIEDVYWRHRIWPRNRGERPDPKPSLDVVMSQATIEKKVQDYLRNSELLEQDWQKPITAEQLQAEMERMASHTKHPRMLREIFAALGNDPFVIAECLARPVLAERLVNGDPVAMPLRRVTQKVPQARGYSEDAQVPMKVAAIHSIAKAVQVNRPYQLPLIASPSGGLCNDNTWTATTNTNAPRRPSQLPSSLDWQ